VSLSFLLLIVLVLNGAVNAQSSFMIRISPASSTGVQLSRGDLNNDGIPDLLMGNNGGSDGSAITAYLGNGDGTVRPPIDGAAGSAAFAIATGDFNNDGTLDVAIGGYTANALGFSKSCSAMATAPSATLRRSI
jgi:hypothetical protein